MHLNVQRAAGTDGGGAAVPLCLRGVYVHAAIFGEQLVLQQQNGLSTTVVDGMNSTINWLDQRYIGLWQGVTQVQLLSNDSFTLTELAAQYDRCFEAATIDMQQVYSVSLIRWAPRKCTQHNFNSVVIVQLQQQIS